MSQSDPIADMLTSIRNANTQKQATATLPASRAKIGVLEALKREGFIVDFQIQEQAPQNKVVVTLKYGPEGEKVINKIQRASKPGCRVYSQAKDLRPVRNGFGINVLSTSHGILSDRECRSKNVGGEVLCTVY